MKPKKGKLLKCNHCSKEYKSAGFLRRHQQYYCTPSTDEDPDSRSEPPGKYYCIFCDKNYPTAALFNRHYPPCLRNYDASRTKKASSSAAKSSSPVKLHVCSYCQKGFSRLGTYKCHLSCHQKEEKKPLKSVIRSVCGNAKEPSSTTSTGIVQPDVSSLPRIPRLSERRIHSDHTFCKPPDAGPLPEPALEPTKPAVEPIEPAIRLTVMVDNDEVYLIKDMPKLTIQDIRHVERVEAIADSTEGLSMPQLEPHEMYPEVSNSKGLDSNEGVDSNEDLDWNEDLVSNEDPNQDDVIQQLLDDMHVTDDDEEEESPQTGEVSSSRIVVSSSDKEDLAIVEEPADRPDGSQPETDQVLVEQAVPETVTVVSSSADSTIVLSEGEEDVVIIEEPMVEQQQRKQDVRETSTTTVINLLDSKPFQCTICSRKFRTEFSLTLHYRIHRSKTYNRVNPPPKCSTGDPRCCCQRSHSVFSSQPKVPSFKCSTCGFTGANQNALLKHKLLFHRKYLTCQKCKRKFRTRFTRLLHMRTHRSEAE